ncbi:MAG: alpha/beta hydrolase [Anaerolineales bacterium]|nr:alpha/beta hydrolase [Anaerolineales bacterium]
MPARALQGLHVNYITEGNGPPVILVHGVGGSLRHWDYLYPDLVSQKYEVYALDLLGHGESAKPINHHPGYHIDAIYAHLANWMSRLDLHTAPILIGHAMGAYLVLTYVLRNPGKVRGIVLVNPYFSPSQLSLPLRLPILQPQLSAKMLTLAPKWALSSAVSLTQRGGDLISKEVRERMVDDLKRSDPNVITFAKTTQDLTPHLKRIRTRTIVIWGENDPLFHPTHYAHLVNSVPNSVGCPIPGSHNPHLTNIRLFNNQVLKFLDQLSGGLNPTSPDPLISMNKPAPLLEPPNLPRADQAVT